jgi:hypothetical protein
MAIVRNIQNNDVYRYLGNNIFKNLRTGNEGEVSDEVAKKVFKINLEATELINENPILEEMIKALNLKFDNNKNEKL